MRRSERLRPPASASMRSTPTRRTKPTRSPTPPLGALSTRAGDDARNRAHANEGMKSIEELKSKYAERAVNRAGCWLLDVNAALDFLADLEANKIAVNGIEGYWLRGNAIEPSLANSVYFIGTDIRVASLKGS